MRIEHTKLSLERISDSLRAYKKGEVVTKRFILPTPFVREIAEATLFATYLWHRDDDKDSIVTIEEILAVEGIIIPREDLMEFKDDIWYSMAAYSNPIIIGWVGRTSIISNQVETCTKQQLR